MPRIKRRLGRRRTWGAAAALTATLISLAGCIVTVRALISGAYELAMFPPLAVALATLAGSVGGMLFVLRRLRSAAIAFVAALVFLIVEAITSLLVSLAMSLPASPLEAASFAVVAIAGVVASLAAYRWPTVRIAQVLTRGAVLWALTIAGVGLAGWINLLDSVAETAVDASATWWGWAVAVLIGLCLLACINPGVRTRSQRTRITANVLLGCWIVCAPVVIALITNVLVSTDDAATARATTGWMVIILGALAATAAGAANWIVVDRELARVTNVAADGTIVVDQAFQIVSVDAGAARLFGWQRDELAGQSLEVLIPGRFRPAHEDRANAFMENPERRSMGLVAAIGLCKDGSEFEAEIVLAPVGHGPLVSAAVWELTGNRLERRRARFRDRLVAVTEQSSHGFFIEDIDGIATETNDALCRMLGESRNQCLGASIVNRCLPADIAIIDEALGKMAAGHSDHAEWRARYLRHDDSWFWAEVEVTRLMDEHGRVEGISGQLRDVSAEVAERDLRVATEGLLTAATEAAPIGLAVTNPDGFHQRVNQAYCDMTGYRPDELTMCTVQSITDPSDWPDENAARARLRDAADGASAPVEVLDKRLRRSDGTEIWVRLHLRALRSSDGVATAFVSQTIDITEERRAETAASLAQAELKYRSSHDSLTGARNRANIIEVLTGMLAASKAGNVGLLFLDLDRFKQINDDISHAAGDQVLVEVANRLRGATRANDCFGRIGGDEFIVVLGDLTSPSDAAAVAEHIRGSISAVEFTADGIKLSLTVSMGIAVSRPGQTAAELLRDADAALQLAKVSGRDGARLHDDDLRTNVARRKETAKLLKRAVFDGAIQAWFQPIVQLSDRRMVGMEAVARWVEPGASPVRAVEFIGIAEQTGLLSDLGMAVIGQALAHLSALPEQITMAVNVATVQLHRSSLRSGIASLLSNLDLPAERLVIEVAEASLLALRPSARRDLDALISAGVRLHVSGFGAGDSSLSQLRDFPVSGLKLDRSVVRHLGADPLHPMVRLATGLGSLAAEFGLMRIAEGVETEQQAEAVMAAGWPLGQGWLFGEAEPAPELASSRELTSASALVIHNRRRGDGRGTIFVQTRRLDTDSAFDTREPDCGSVATDAAELSAN